MIRFILSNIFLSSFSNDMILSWHWKTMISSFFHNLKNISELHFLFHHYLRSWNSAFYVSHNSHLFSIYFTFLLLFFWSQSTFLPSTLDVHFFLSLCLSHTHIHFQSNCNSLSNTVVLTYILYLSLPLSLSLSLSVSLSFSRTHTLSLYIYIHIY